MFKYCGDTEGEDRWIDLMELTLFLEIELIYLKQPDHKSQASTKKVIKKNSNYMRKVRKPLLCAGLSLEGFKCRLNLR